MKIAARGVVHCGPGKSPRAVATFPAVATLPNGTLLATYRVGSTKDSVDGTIELRRSADGGMTWSEGVSPFATEWQGRSGSLWLAYVTILGGEQLLMAAMWVDRTEYPGHAIFNPETEGCLPTNILLADSYDGGRTWTEWRELPVFGVGPPSLTNPILYLPDGTLIASIESNKSYQDTSPWRQRVVYCFSDDGGVSWSNPRVVTEDPECQLCHWDQRAAVSPDGVLASYTWTYDRRAMAYQNVQRRLSRDRGWSWSSPEDLGVADQPGRPAVLPNGQVLLPWVDRFQTGTIRARLAKNIEASFSAHSETVLYDSTATKLACLDRSSSTGLLLEDMGKWRYGLPYAENISDDAVLVVHYAPSDAGTQIDWIRIEVYDD